MNPKSCFELESNRFGFLCGKQLNNKNIFSQNFVPFYFHKFQQKDFAGFLKETFDNWCCQLEIEKLKDMLFLKAFDSPLCKGDNFYNLFWYSHLPLRYQTFYV